MAYYRKLAILGILFSIMSATPSFAATITVDTATDEINANGNCSLREAVINANNDNQSGSTDCTAGNGADTITVPAGTYTLDIGATNEHLALNGDLDITAALTITGAGSGSTIIDGNNTERIFHLIGSGSINISGLTVQNGNAVPNTSHGGGLYINGGGLVLSDIVVTGNNAEDGGGIYNLGGTVTISDSTISNNTAQGTNGGGGIYNSSGLIIERSTISGNSTTKYGGGIWSDGGVLTITNSTVSNNTGSLRGGGVYQCAGGGATTTITYSTISNNSSPGGGGIGPCAADSGVITVSNTIVANQKSGDDCAGLTITSTGYNLASDAKCGFAATGDMNSTNPLLSALANNGGSTLTHALNYGSPAIDAGNNATCASAPIDGVDQRGVNRSDGACDIGAYEYFESASHTLVVYKTGAPPAGMGYIYSDPAGISCPGTCSATFARGTEVTLYAKNTNGMEFLRYEGACADVQRASPCVLTMDGYKEVPVRFYPPETRLMWLKLDPETGIGEPVPFGDNTIEFTSDMLQDGCSDMTVILHNSADRSLDVGMIGGLDPLESPFAITDDTCSDTTLPNHTDCSIMVKYCPADDGPYTDTFDLPSSDPNFPTQTVEVTGGN
ncbi:hypothetical protein MNBD_NITROSPINAE03-534 [hydrothermal vent metagenome]|uniref:CSLREA domain-containing protein n=1 Tax=hydrothermal vent metagenome TaxID=652676 RepID=A0A3B1CAV3_9ZZZZ